MKNNDLVSIIIPTFNQADYVDSAIRSALSQDYENLEVIVADDCSSFNLEKTVQGLQDKRLKYFRNTHNIGRVANYRKALYDYAKGDWVLNLDGDDFLVDQSFIRAAVQAAQAENDTLVVCADRYVMDSLSSYRESVEKAATAKVEYMDGTEYILSLPRPKWRIHHLATLYNRQAAMDLDFYRSDIISSDYESIYRLILGHRLAHIHAKVAVWRQHKHNASRTVDMDEKIRNFSLFTDIKTFAESRYPELQLDNWLCRNIARRYYSSFLYQLGDGDFKNLSILSSFIKSRYPRSYRLVHRSPKTYIKSIFFLCKFICKRICKRHKKTV